MPATTGMTSIARKASLQAIAAVLITGSFFSAMAALLSISSSISAPPSVKTRLHWHAGPVASVIPEVGAACWRAAFSCHVRPNLHRPEGATDHHSTVQLTSVGKSILQ